MSNAAVTAEGLGKRYRIGALDKVRGRRHILGSLADALRAPFGNLRRLKGLSTFGDDDSEGVFWALRDISFTLHEGEVLGVVGRNGAGKSTLLKILSRITEPTTGHAEVAGRVGSLLEVGTGFHLELTGRENVYLNGSILGMRRSYIDSQFDAIVEFAGVDQFIDTPVKRYSSGMHLRLAFAVAAHLEPDVLIIDEILAVGDAEFQRKCLAKMGDVARGGRTVLFVSHNLDAVRALCPRALLLDKGRLIGDGPTPDILRSYLATTSLELPGDWIDLERAHRDGTGEVRIRAVKYTSHNAEVGLHPYPDGPLEVLLEVDSDATRNVGSVGVSLSSLAGANLVSADSMATGSNLSLRKGRNVIRLEISRLHLMAGRYRLSFWLADPLSGGKSWTAYDLLEDVLDIEVVSKKAIAFGGRVAGLVVNDATFGVVAPPPAGGPGLDRPEVGADPRPSAVRAGS